MKPKFITNCIRFILIIYMRTHNIEYSEKMLGV